MAIQWGGFNGHLRVGIQWSTESYTYATASIDVYIDTYVQCDSTYSFNDSQTVTLSGSRSATYNFSNTLGPNQQIYLGRQTIGSQGQSPNGGPTYTANAVLSGAFNGASPSVSTSFSLPAKPPNPNSPPNVPVPKLPASGAVVNSGTGAVTFTWTHSDPDGDAQAAYLLRLQNPAGTWFRWDGTNLVADTSASVVTATQSATIPSGKIANSGLWHWTIATRDASGLWSANSAARNLYTSSPPTVTVTAPPNPANVARPPVSWTYADAEGTAQNGWQAQIVKSSVYSAAGYNPDNMTGMTWSNSATSTATTATPDVDLPNHTTMRAYVKVNSSPNPVGGLQYSTWGYQQFDLHVPPYASSVVTPNNGAIIDLAAGFTMSWSNSFYIGTGGNTSAQAAFAIRRIQSGGSYQWWNGATWQATEYFLSGTTASYSFRSGEVANAIPWTFSISIRDGYGGQAPYSNGVTVTGSTAAVATVIQPTSVVTITNPIIQWSMYDIENDPQQTYQVRVISYDVYNLGISDPLTATAVWDTGEIVDATTRQVETPVDLENGKGYRAYVRVKTTGVYSGWSYSEFVVSLQPPAQPSLTVTVLDDDGSVQIDIQGRDSMMSSDTGRAYAGWGVAANATVTGPQAGFTAAQSDYAMRFQSVAAGNFSIRTTDNFPVVVGTGYTAAASLVRAGASTARAFHVDIEWLSSALAVVGTTTGATTAVDTTEQRSIAVGSPPSTAAYARVVIVVVGATAAAEAHDMYDPVLRPDVGNEWSPGGLLGNTSVSLTAQNPYRIIRNGLNIPMPTDTQKMTIYDEEVPIGVEQVYGGITRAIYPGATLASATTLSDPVLWSSGWLWLSDPLRPDSGRSWAPQSFGSVTRPVRQGKFRPIGRPDAILTTGVRALREGSFTLVTHTKEEREAFDDFVDRSDIVLMRIPPDQGETAGETIYVRFEGDAPQDRPSPHRVPHRTIEQRWVEQRRPLTQLEYTDGLNLSDLGIRVFIGLDTDGTPYYDPNVSSDASSVALGRDIDDVVFFVGY